MNRKFYSRAFSSYLFITFFVVFFSCTTKQETPKKTLNELQTDQVRLNDFIGKDYLIDAQHSYMGFKIKYFGFSPVRGRFNEFDGTVFYNPENISALSATLLIDVTTINTGNETRDEDLKREGTWFDAANFPFAKFQSRKVEAFEDGSFNLIGELTIKGISKEIVLEFEEPTSISRDWAKNEQVDFSGKATINRQDFEVYGGSFWSSVMENGLTQLSDEVELEIDMHIRRADYQARFEDSEPQDPDRIILDAIKTNGLEEGMRVLNDFHSKEELRAGTLSTVAYTLNAWEMYNEAGQIFSKKAEWFGENPATLNQIGITQLFQGNTTGAEASFKKSFEADSINSRAIEYLRLIKN